MNHWDSLLTWSNPFPSALGALASLLVVIWFICLFVAVVLSPFILIRLYRALGHFNSAHERDDWLTAPMYGKEPTLKRERND